MLHLIQLEVWACTWGNCFVQQDGYRDLRLFQYRHSPPYVRVVFHGTLHKLNFM